ncbi:MAG: beta-ketoacyl synthase N-terminal-like domain-containing protein, partial [Bacteroidota bacterium]
MQTLYINGAARIGAAFEAAEAIAPGQLEEPDYTRYIPKRQLRRLDRASKFALHTTYAALERAGCETVDGVVLGVGQTISETVDGMLRKLISHREEQTNPTSFMNSLLSTAAGQIALKLSCSGYTNTHTQRGFTVEAALLDASLQLHGNTGANFIVGGVGEIHPSYNGLAGNYGHIGAMLSAGVDGPVGEGAAIFVVSGKPNPTTKACLKEVYTVYLTDETARTSSSRELQDLLFTDALPEVNLVISGRPAGSEAQGIY